jgi:hypothetical protein
LPFSWENATTSRRKEPQCSPTTNISKT